MSRLLVSDRAHVIMPYHKLLDGLEEDARAETEGGQPRHHPPGVGPAYMDRTARIGIRMGDLLHEETLLTKLSSVLPAKNAILTKIYGAKPLELHGIYLHLVEQGEQPAQAHYAHRACDSPRLAREAPRAAGRRTGGPARP